MRYSHMDAEAFRRSVHDFANSLQVEQLRSLSEGVGLGSLSPVKREPVSKEVSSSAPDQSHPAPAAVGVTGSQTQRVSSHATSAPIKDDGRMVKAAPSRRAYQGEDEQQSSLLYRSLCWLLSLLVDILFVSLCAVSLLIVMMVGVYGEIRIDQVVEFWNAATLHGHALQLTGIVSAVVFALYVVYWLVFRIVAGSTIGRLLMMNQKRSPECVTANALDHRTN